MIRYMKKLSAEIIGVLGYRGIMILLALLLFFLLFAWIKSRLRYRKYKRGIEKKEAEQRATRERRYVTARMKEHILERDNYTCQICGISRDFLNSYAEGLGDYLLLEVDHIVPVKQGGSGDDEDNLQVLCWRCNRKKSGTKTNEDVAEQIDYGIHLFFDE